MEEENITIVPEEQGVQNDELATLTAEQMLENFRNDVAAYEKALEKAIADKANYEVQFEIDKKIYEIVGRPGALKALNPNFAYETDPEFEKLREEKQKFKIRQDLALGEGQLKQYDAQIQSIKEALQGAKDKLERFSKEE